MAERSRNDAGEFTGIPSGLNRIKTRRVGPRDKEGSGAEDFGKFIESPSGGGVSSSGQKQKSFSKGHVKFASPKEGHNLFVIMCIIIPVLCMDVLSAFNFSNSNWIFS